LGIWGYRGGTWVFGRLEWKKAFGRNGHRYDTIIKTDFQEIEWSGEIDWTSLAEWSTDVLL